LQSLIAFLIHEKMNYIKSFCIFWYENN
jgi:hypothetical protein